MLNFCFVKSDLRVWEDIWEKSGRKINHIVGKTWNLFVFKSLEKRNHSVAKFVYASKSFWRDIDGKSFKSKCWSLIECEEKVHKGVGISKTSFCNRFSKWCQKFRKMMDIDASPESSLLVQKPSECLNLLFQLIYFLAIASIWSFGRMRSQNLTWKKCCMFLLCHLKILAQNSRFTKKCWLFAESLSWVEADNFFLALRRVNSSIQRTPVLLIFL